MIPEMVCTSAGDNPNEIHKPSIRTMTNSFELNKSLLKKTVTQIPGSIKDSAIDLMDQVNKTESESSDESTIDWKAIADMIDSASGFPGTGFLPVPQFPQIDPALLEKLLELGESEQDDQVVLIGEDCRQASASDDSRRHRLDSPDNAS